MVLWWLLVLVGVVWGCHVLSEVLLFDFYGLGELFFPTDRTAGKQDKEELLLVALKNVLL